MLLERCSGGDLKDFVGLNKYFAEEEGMDVVGRCLFSALGHIHDKSIIHRDVKPENVLVDHRPGDVRPYRTVLVDFGISCHMSDKARLADLCGSPGCVGPEVLMGSLPTPKADVFGGGVTLYYAISGKMPFKGTRSHGDAPR